MKDSRFDFNQIPFLIISAKSMDRSLELKQNLKRFNLNIVDSPAFISPTYEVCDEFKIQYDHKLFQFAFGRPLTPGEIGCAHAHNIARRYLSNSLFGGVILEDDARITNPMEFSKTVSDFLRKNLGRPAVLSLAGLFPKPLSRVSKPIKDKKNEYYKLFGQPPLAVAYAVTPLAARLLSESNSPIKFTADWPDAPVNYFVTNPACAFHGDSLTSSIIDSQTQIRRPKNIRSVKNVALSISRFLSFSNTSVTKSLYIRIVWFRPLLWRLDLFQSRIKKW